MSRTGALRKPITAPRSLWQQLDVEPGPMLTQPGMVEPYLFERRVHDGTLRAIRTADDGALHLSISWTGNSARQAKRYPTWDEIADARDALLPDDLEFWMILPRSSEYVAVHDTTFHLHQAPAPEETTDVV